MKILIVGLASILLPLFAFAQVAPATIITRAGNVTAPLKYYINKDSLRSALATGVNHSIKVTVTAQNESKEFAEQFDTVQLFDDAGALIGRNVALKSDALSTNRYSFIFKNFGIADLSTVAGVQITFFPVGGNNPTDKITVSGVTISLERENGEACIIADPITIITPEKPPPTVRDIQTARPLVQPGTHGDGTSGGGGGGSTDTGFRNPGSASGGFLPGDVGWMSVSNVLTSNNVYATATLGVNQTTQGMYAYNFGFSVPNGATINGITATIERNGQTNISDSAVMLTTDGGTTAGSNLAQGAWSMTEQVVTYGGAANTWGLTIGVDITPTIVNSSAFGLVLAAITNSSGGATASVDNIQMKITYTTGGGSAYDSFMDLIRTIAQKISCRIAPSSSCKK